MSHAHDAEELACVYASLICHDEGMAITAEKLLAGAKAAGIHLQAFWPAVFAKVYGEKGIAALIEGVSAAPVAAAPAAAAGAAAPAEEKKVEEEKVEEEEEEEEGDFGLDLFG